MIMENKFIDGDLTGYRDCVYYIESHGKVLDNIQSLIPLNHLNWALELKDRLLQIRFLIVFDHVKERDINMCLYKKCILYDKVNDTRLKEITNKLMNERYNTLEKYLKDLSTFYTLLDDKRFHELIGFINSYKNGII